jgi:hypothetical protein
MNIEKCCATCTAYVPENEAQGVCRARPPVPIVVGMSQPKVALANGAPPQPVFSGAFAPVGAQSWCRDGWEPQRDLRPNFSKHVPSEAH